MNDPIQRKRRHVSQASIMFRRCAVVAIGAFVAMAGCSRPPTTIEGRVTLDGEPLDAAAMMFYPAAGNGPTRHAFTDTKGRYTAKVFPTKATVTISLFRPTGEVRDGQQVLEQAMPPRYLDPQKTVLVIEPAEGRKTVCDFPLTTQP